MAEAAIRIENLSKLYKLGEVGTGSFAHDINKWWQMKIRGKPDPYAKIGSKNDRTQEATKGEYIWALRNINLEVNRGEVVGVIGKNGAGKSTLLKLLSKVTSPTTGSIKSKGRIASLLEVGTGFHPEMTGRENIFMNGTIMGMNRHEIRAKLDEIVEFAGVAKYLDTPTKRYSSGMTVRLGFAVAAFLEPEILIVDEVLAVGDAEFQKRAIGKIKEVSSGEGRTVLFVSHNMSSIKNLCESIVLLKNGEVEKHGNDVDRIVNDYLGLYDGNELGYLDSENYLIQSSELKIKSIKYSLNCFKINLDSTQPYDNLAIVLKVFANDGTLLFKTSTNPIWSSRKISIHGKKEVKLSFDSLGLIPGNYFLGLDITIPKEKVLLSINNAFQFEYVSSVEFDGDKELIQGSDGFLKIDHQWDF